MKFCNRLRYKISRWIYPETPQKVRIQRVRMVGGDSDGLEVDVSATSESLIFPTSENPVKASFVGENATLKDVQNCLSYGSEEYGWPEVVEFQLIGKE